MLAMGYPLVGPRSVTKARPTRTPVPTFHNPLVEPTNPYSFILFWIFFLAPSPLPKKTNVTLSPPRSRLTDCLN